MLHSRRSYPVLHTWAQARFESSLSIIYANNVQHTKFWKVCNVYAVLNLKEEALWTITQGAKIETR